MKGSLWELLSLYLSNWPVGRFVDVPCETIRILFTLTGNKRLAQKSIGNSIFGRINLYIPDDSQYLFIARLDIFDNYSCRQFRRWRIPFDKGKNDIPLGDKVS